MAESDTHLPIKVFKGGKKRSYIDDEKK